MKLSLLIHGIADLVMPRRCACCGRTLLLREDVLCTGCLADLPLTWLWKREANPMSEAFNALLQREKDSSGDTEYQPPGRAAALFHYRSGYRNLTRDLKYRRNFGAGRFAAGMLGSRLAESPLFADVDLVAPVPLHFGRMWTRGYNQAAVIAGEVASALGVRFCPHLLARRRRTSSQTGFDRDGRMRNVRGGFTLGRSGRKALANASHILLVDDVFTTGATLAACERALRRFLGSGPRISVSTLSVVAD